MGMDWHSSGITTSVVGALKRGLEPVRGELGTYVCGGRGRHSRATPTELIAVAERTGLDGAALVQRGQVDLTPGAGGGGGPSCGNAGAAGVSEATRAVELR